MLFRSVWPPHRFCTWVSRRWPLDLALISWPCRRTQGQSQSWSSKRQAQKLQRPRSSHFLRRHCTWRNLWFKLIWCPCSVLYWSCSYRNSSRRKNFSERSCQACTHSRYHRSIRCRWSNLPVPSVSISNLLDWLWSVYGGARTRNRQRHRKAQSNASLIQE